MLTLLRIWAAYQTGSMRYGLLFARSQTGAISLFPCSGTTCNLDE